MSRISIKRFSVLCSILTASFALAITACSHDPKESVALVRSKVSEPLQTALLALSADSDLSDAARTTCLSAAKEESSGSGFVIDGYVKDGKSLLVTNNHVIANADHPSISFDGGDTTVAGDIVFRDPESDLAIVRFKGTPPGLKLASSYETSDEVTAVGYPAVDKQSVFQKTVGAIANPCVKGGKFVESEDAPARVREACWIKHTASIDPGSSGGPLLTKRNAVVGVNTMIKDDLHNAFFSIPSGSVLRAVVSAEEALSRRGDRPWMTAQLKETCRRFLGELTSTTPNSTFLKDEFSDEFVAASGHQAYVWTAMHAEDEGSNMIIASFLRNTAETFRGALARMLRHFFRISKGLAGNERCEHLNANDDVLQPNGTVRITVQTGDQDHAELIWIYEAGAWRLRNFKYERPLF